MMPLAAREQAYLNTRVPSLMHVFTGSLVMLTPAGELLLHAEDVLKV